MTYLAVTAVNRPNKSETIQEIRSAEKESIEDAGAESPYKGKNTKAIISESTAIEVILEPTTVLETASAMGRVIPTSKTVVVAESREIEVGSAADQLLFDGGATVLDR